ncbi:MAG: type II secretion system protein GspJ [Nitrospirota bacterium]
MKHSKTAGFTLIEILISFSIVMLVVGILYSTFRSTIATSEQMDRESDPFRLARVAFYQMTRDISMIHDKVEAKNQNTVFDTGASFGTTLLNGKDSSRFFDGENVPNDSVTFLSFAAPPVLQGFPEWGQAEISYSILENALIRRVRFRDRPDENELGEFVVGLNFRYFDVNKEEWRDEWDSKEQQGSPAAIEVTLMIKKHFEGAVRTLQTRIEIPLVKSL